MGACGESLRVRQIAPDAERAKIVAENVDWLVRRWWNLAFTEAAEDTDGVLMEIKAEGMNMLKPEMVGLARD